MLRSQHCRKVRNKADLCVQWMVGKEATALTGSPIFLIIAVAGMRHLQIVMSNVGCFLSVHFFFCVCVCVWILLGDLLENYCWDDDLMNFSRVLFSISILLTFPIECFVSREVSKIACQITADPYQLPLFIAEIFTIFLRLLRSHACRLWEIKSIDTKRKDQSNATKNWTRPKSMATTSTGTPPTSRWPLCWAHSLYHRWPSAWVQFWNWMYVYYRFATHW